MAGGVLPCGGDQMKVLLLAGLIQIVCGQITDVSVELVAPRWVARGGSATLHCLHQVPPALLYKVEFLRTDAKLMQFVRERKPPYTHYQIAGGTLNMSRSTESSITIDKLSLAATAYYWCEVSLETPIYTAASQPKLLTVVQPQKHPPIITFSEPNVVVGGMLRANCTSAPAAPAPHLTWYIDGEKVQGESLRHYTFRVAAAYRNGGFRKKSKYRKLTLDPPDKVPKKLMSPNSASDSNSTNSTKNAKCTLNDVLHAELRERPKLPPPPPQPQLSVSVSELRVPAHGKLQLTCTSTIPDDVAPDEHFADMKKQTVAVEMSELIPKKPVSEETKTSAGTNVKRSASVFLWFSLFMLYLHTVETYK